MNKTIVTTETAPPVEGTLSVLEQQREEALLKLRSASPVIDKTIPAAPAVRSTYSASSYQRKPGGPGKR